MEKAFEYSGSKLIYRWKIGSYQNKNLLVMAVFWNAIVCMSLYGLFFSTEISVNDSTYSSFQEAFIHNPSMLIFVIFPIIGLALGYWALSVWFNKTTFTWDGMHLRLTTRPFPIRKDVSYSRSAISSVFVKEVLIQRFGIFIKTIDGKEIELFRVGIKKEHADELEKWIKERLNLD